MFATSPGRYIKLFEFSIHTSVEVLHFTFQISTHTFYILLLKFHLRESETLTRMTIKMYMLISEW